METKMKNNNYRTIMVKRGMGMMAVAVLSAMLLVGCGQNGQDTERVGDRAAEGSNVVGDDTNIEKRKQRLSQTHECT